MVIDKFDSEGKMSHVEISDVEAIQLVSLESSDEKNYCRNNRFAYVCTREMGHDGEHVAHGMERPVVATWE